MSKYIVLRKSNQDLPDGYYTYIALVDRRITRDTWWSDDKSLCMKFDLVEAAMNKAHQLRYGSCIVIAEKEFDSYVDKIYDRNTHSRVNISIGD